MHSKCQGPHVEANSAGRKEKPLQEETVVQNVFLSLPLLTRVTRARRLFLSPFFFFFFLKGCGENVCEWCILGFFDYLKMKMCMCVWAWDGVEKECMCVWLFRCVCLGMGWGGDRVGRCGCVFVRVCMDVEVDLKG